MSIPEALASIILGLGAYFFLLMRFPKTNNVPLNEESACFTIDTLRRSFGLPKLVIFCVTWGKYR